MLNIFFKKEKNINKYKKIVNIIKYKEYFIKKLKNKKLQNKTIKFKNLLKNGLNLNKILPEAFAVFKESFRRIFNIKYFDNQLIAGIALHFGKIIELNTGEGKTLISFLPAYLNSLTGNSVHIITVNKYLSLRDFYYSKKIFNFLGLKVNNIFNIKNKKNICNFDIIFGSNEEFVFNYLKYNKILLKKNKIKYKFNFAIIDEIDLILIDESKIPLIISKKYKKNKSLFYIFNFISKNLIKENNLNIYKKKYFIINNKKNEILLTDVGYKKIEKILININLLKNKYYLYSSLNILYIYHLNIALIANILYIKNQHYIIKNNKIIIIDKFTGRLSKNKRLSEGIHQAIEVKENLSIKYDSKLISLITFKNYFKIYKKIAGMTATANTKSNYFKNIYNLNIIKIPSNFNVIRKDLKDKFFYNDIKKYNFILKDIIKRNNKFQPILIITNSLKKSEILSKLLNKNKLFHNILNAKNYIDESKIISKIGYPKMITIATNILNRGIDIILGGDINYKIKNIKKNKIISNKKKKKKIFFLYKKWKKLNNKIIKLGGLHVISLERNKFKRIDNQLIGRSGRRGKPGSSRFYLSFDDFLFKNNFKNKFFIFLNKIKIKNIFFKKNIFINLIKYFQKKNELFNFKNQKKYINYDNIYYYQIKFFYKKRNFFLKNKNIFKFLINLNKLIFVSLFKKINFNKKNNINIFLKILNKKWFLNIFLLNFIIKKYNLFKKKILKIILIITNNIYKKYLNYLKIEKFNIFFRKIILKIFDLYWEKYLFFFNYLIKNINLIFFLKNKNKLNFFFKSFIYFYKMLFLIKKYIIKNILLLNNKFNKYK